MVHEEDASDSVDCESSLSLIAVADRGAGVGLANSGLSQSPSFTFSGSCPSIKETLEAITHDSPKSERPGVRDDFVDMALIT